MLVDFTLVCHGYFTDTGVILKLQSNDCIMAEQVNLKCVGRADQIKS